MKIAGLKNDGAWFRTNKAIHNLNDAGRSALSAMIKLATVTTQNAAFNDILSLMAECGVPQAPEDAVTTVDAWIGRMVLRGIPRQVWYGKLTFSTYAKTTNLEGEDIYVKNYDGNIANFAKQLRKACSKWLHAQRARNDLFDVETPGEFNPGKNPDSLKTS